MNGGAAEVAPAPAAAALVRFELRAPGEPAREAAFLTEAGDPPPSSLGLAHDQTTADGALGAAKSGRSLLYRGNWKNARQLVDALGRRLARRRPEKGSPSPLDAFRSERAQRRREHEVQGRILVELGPGWSLALGAAPDVREACELAWGPWPGLPVVLSIPTLLGALGAAEWSRKGLAVPGLSRPLVPRYGVYTPTRSEYVRLILEAPPPTGRRIFDVGTGTGVLAFVLLERGAASAVATDREPRAVACARDNAARLGLQDRFRVEERDLFPDGRADLVVCNPPWIPDVPRTALDRAVFDPGGELLRRFIAGLPERLAPGGEGWLLLGDLAELLSLRPADWLGDELARAGLEIRWRRSTSPDHRRTTDERDPLRSLRARETTTLYALGVRDQK